MYLLYLFVSKPEGHIIFALTTYKLNPYLKGITFKLGIFRFLISKLETQCSVLIWIKYVQS